MEVLHQPLMATVHVVKAITITVALRQAVCFHKVMAQPGLQAFQISMLVSELRGSGTHSNSHFPLSPPSLSRLQNILHLYSCLEEILLFTTG